MKRLLAHVKTAAPSVQGLRSEIPDNLARLIGSMMAKSPEDRPASAQAAAKALASYAADAHLSRLALGVRGAIYHVIWNRVSFKVQIHGVIYCDRLVRSTSREKLFRVASMASGKALLRVFASVTAP